jgi:two-component system sensor histidine kinase MtrB
VELAGLVATAVRAHGWADRLRLEGGEVVLETDPRRVERIVTNLIANALDHGGGDVTVRVGADDPGAFVEVSDGGPGISPEDLPHLFERFYKADTARSGHGTGLGLSLALENARLLGGDIDVQSKPGEGSRFMLRLPVTKPLPGGEDGVATDRQA